MCWFWCYLEGRSGGVRCGGVSGAASSLYTLPPREHTKPHTLTLTQKRQRVRENRQRGPQLNPLPKSSPLPRAPFYLSSDGLDKTLLTFTEHRQ